MLITLLYPLVSTTILINYCKYARHVIRGFSTMVLTQILRLFFICCLISSPVLSMCFNPTKSLNISLVTRSRTDISEVFNAQNKIGGFTILTENRTCYEIVVRILSVDNDIGLRAVYDHNLKLELESSDLIIGQYFESVESLANSIGKYYIVAEPMSFRQEMQRSGNFTLSVWPSYTIFFGAVKSNAELFFQGSGKIETEKVTIVHYTDSENGMEVLDALEESLRKPERILTLIDLDRSLEELENNPEFRHHPSFVYDTMEAVRGKLEAVDVVIIYIDTEVEKKSEVIQLLLGGDADLYGDDKLWLIADILFPYQGGALRKFSDFSILKSEVYYMKFYIGDLKSENNCVESDVGTFKTGLELIKRIVKETGPQMIENGIYEGLVKYFVLDERNLDTYEIPYYPRDVSIEIMWIKPNIFKEWYLNSSFSYCGLFRSRFMHGMHPVPDHEWEEKKGHLFFYDKDFFLQGLPPYRQNFTVMVLEAMPFVRRKADGEFEGMAIDMFNAVQLELQKSRIFLNFQFEVRTVYGSKVNGKWNGIFHDLGMSETEDGVINDRVLGLGMISKTPERSAEFEFTAPVYESYVTYTVARRHYQNMFQFMMPFTFHVWLALLGVAVVSAIVLYLFQAWNPFRTEIDSKHLLPLSESLWHSFLIITHMGAPFGMLTAPNRIFTMSFWFFALVIVGSYTGSLASFLSHSTVEIPLQTIDDILQTSPKRISATANSSMSDYVRKRRGDFRVDDKDFVVDYDEGLEKVRTEDFIFVGSYPGLRYHETHDPTNSLITHTERSSAKKTDDIAFPIQNGWEFKDDFKSAFDRVSERGELRKIVHKWLEVDSFSSSSSSTKDQESLGIETSLGIVVVLAISAFCSYFCLALKMMYLKCQNLNKEEVEQSEHRNHNPDDLYSISNGTLDSTIDSTSQIDINRDSVTRL